MSSIDDLNIAGDRLVGAREIAEFRGEPVERTRYLIRKGVIPFYREGARIIASRRALIDYHVEAAKVRRGEATQLPSGT